MRRMGLYVFLTAVWAVGGIAGQSAGAPPKTSKTEHAVQRMPTADRPIVYIGPRVNGLIFGGPDGDRRIRMARTPDVTGMSICPSGKLAGVLRRADQPPRLRLTFYDVSGRSVGKADLPAGLSGGSIWLGPRKEAIVVLARLPLHEVPVIRDPRRRPADPMAGRVCYYANARGVVAPLDVPGFSEARFTTTPGFVVLAAMGPDKSRAGWRVWRLFRYADKCWEVEIRTRRHAMLMPPSRYRSPEGAEVTLALGDEYLHFRPDGTHFARLVNRKDFARANPGYVARAGSFYETKYLPKAVAQLAEQAALTEKEEAAARAVLKGYIYGWLKTLVRCNGRMPAEAHQVLVAQLDKDMAGPIGESKFGKYLRWRKDTTGALNALAFLLHPRYDVPPERDRRVKLIYSASAKGAKPPPEHRQ